MKTKTKRDAIRFLCTYGAASIVVLVCLVPLCLVIALVLVELHEFLKGIM